MKHYLYTILTLALIVVGCQQSRNEELYTPEQRGPQFHASFEENTRTYVNEDIKLRWHAEDQITLFVGTTLNKQYQFDGATGDNGGYFSDISTPAFGVGNAVDRHYAVYPYDPAIKLSEDGVLTVTFPTEQRYVEGSFGRGANLMVATTADTSDYDLMFRNVGSYLRVRLWGENQNVSSITVTSLGEKAIAGEATVTPRYNDDPTCVMTGDKKSVTLTCEESVAISTSEDTPTEFWIVLPPVTLAQGFTVYVTNESGNTEIFEVDKSFTFARNTFYSLTRELTLTNSNTPPNDELWYTTTDGKVVNLYTSLGFGAKLVSNTYINGKGVIKFDGDITKIATNAFRDCTYLETLTIPDSVEDVGANAFSACFYIKEFKGKFAADNGRCLIKDSTILGLAYAYGNREYTIPESVTTISKGAFYGGRVIESLIISDNVTTIEAEACSQFLSLKSTTIGRGVTHIGNQAFLSVGGTIYCKAPTPPTLEGSSIFSASKIYVPMQSLSLYQQDAGWSKYASKLNGYSFDDEEEEGDDEIIDENTPPNNEIWYTTNNGKTINIIKEDVFGANIVSNTYAKGKGIIKFDGDVTQILFTANDTATTRATIVKVEGPFSHNDNLETVILPNTITVIEDAAFRDCKNLKAITFPDNLEYIDPTAIAACPKLKELKGKYSADGGRCLIRDNAIFLYALGSGTEYTIPTGVTSIAPRTFAECKTLTKVVIPDGVTTIGQSAFNYCLNLQNITIPNSVTSIGDSAFRSCESLTEITIPQSITKIERYTFNNCKNLMKVTIPQSVVSLGDSAFKRCDKLESIDIPDGVETIEPYTFSYCDNLKSVTIPNSVTSIGEYAFIDCISLTTLLLPKEVKSIGKYAMADCTSLSELYCAAQTPPVLSSFALSNTASNLKIYVPKASVSQYKSAQNWKSYSSAIVGYQFDNEGGEEEEDVPDRETPNNNEIFYTSSNSQVVNPYNTEAFEASIVSNIYSPEKGKGVITFDADITYIGEEAFKGCTTLRSIKLPESIRYISQYGFANTGLTGISLPAKTYHVGDYSFSGCTQLTEVDLGSVIIIGSYAFKDCSLTSVYLPATAESIGNCPFKCSTLKEFKGPNLIGSSTELAIGYSLIQLADGACRNITSYTVPTGVWRIHESVFEGYTNLKKVTIPEGVTDIHKNVFRGCTSLEKIVMPSTLERVGNYILKDCTSLRYIYFKGTTPPVGTDFDNWEPCGTWVTLRVPIGSEETYRNHGYWWDYTVEGVSPDAFDDDESGDDGGNTGGDDGGDDGNLEDLKDGDVIVLQKATKGNGIDIVIMGDAYTKSQISSGKYRRDLETAIELLFDEEPYTSHREFFNIYEVVAESQSSSYSSGSTIFEGFFGGGTLVGGNHDIVAGYASLAVPASRINEALIIVIMNRNYYAGTCYMFYPVIEADYGTGASISYFPLGTDDEMLGQIIRHEAGGHGFAKLFDEYSYIENGRISAAAVAERKAMGDDWGWGKNIDFTSDTNLVKWRHFLNDSRYKYEGLGVYQGGDTYPYGVWRSTNNSIMNDNTGGYNAPSREAIYYRIHKLAYGNSWTYNYESFVSWDSKNRSAKAMSIKKAQTSTVAPTHPPIIVNRPLTNAK